MDIRKFKITNHRILRTDNSRAEVAEPGEAKKRSVSQLKTLQTLITQCLLPLLCPSPWHCAHPSLMAELLYLEMPGAFPSNLKHKTP